MLALLYKDEFDIKLPCINYPLLLFKYIHNLSLPRKFPTSNRILLNLIIAYSLVGIFDVVLRLALLLHVDFSFHDLGSQQRSNLLPEVQLMVLLVISVKLYYPFDSVKRCSRSQTELAAMAIDWDIWSETRQENRQNFLGGASIGRGNEMLVTENDVMKMTGNQLDEYLDWYEKTWINPEKQDFGTRHFPKEILDMFPTGRYDSPTPKHPNDEAMKAAEQDSTDQLLVQIQRRLRMRQVIPDGSEEMSEGPVRRIGDFYKRYRKVEDLTNHARIFYEEASSLIGISVHALIISVLRIERKLQQMRTKRTEDSAERAKEDEDPHNDQSSSKDSDLSSGVRDDSGIPVSQRDD